jgi:hypothetical protein
MNDLTTYGESLILRWLFTDESATRPTAWTVALYSVAPSEAGGGVELSGDGYSRQSVTFTEGGTATATNDADVTFSASADWLEIVAAAVFDGDGNMLAQKTISPAQAVVAGQDFIFRAGSLTVAR